MVARKQPLDRKLLCEPSSGTVRIKSPSDSVKLPLMCGAKYRHAGTLALRLEWRKNTETISGHLPFSKSAWWLDMYPYGLFCPKLELRTEAYFT